MLFERLLGHRGIAVSPTLLGLGKAELKNRLDVKLLAFERGQLGLASTNLMLEGRESEE